MAFLGIEHGDNATHFVRGREGNATPHGTSRAHDLSLSIYLPHPLSTLLILSYMCVPWENKFPQNNNYNLSLPVMMHAPQYLSLPHIQGPPNANLKCDYYCAWPTVCVWGHLFGGFGGPPPHSFLYNPQQLAK
jgi:hypothetical protein